MEKLFEKFLMKIDNVPEGFTRYLMDRIDWTNRLIGIKGARGTGKTTLILQYAKRFLPIDHQSLYVSLDDLYFSENRLVDLVAEFVRKGGKYLLLDEVHRYSNWSSEIKNIYDDHPGLRIIFTGSSIIHLNMAKADLSRRAVMYELTGLSFREYLNLINKLSFPVIKWDRIGIEHTSFARSVLKIVRPLEFFNEYLMTGYYPYFLENKPAYSQKLAETIDLALNTDLSVSTGVNYSTIEKLKQLLFIISQSVPFKPNVTKLGERIGVSRNSLVTYFKYLDGLRIIKRLYSSAGGIGVLQKPDKILMHHPNLQYALAYHDAEKGSIRESFFVNQTGYNQKVYYSQTGDFRIDKTIFEIGGKNKSNRQTRNVPGSFIVSDDMEIGMDNRIPLWLFGFLY